MSWQRRIAFATSAMALLGMISSAALGQTRLLRQEQEVEEAEYMYYRDLAALFTGVLAPYPAPTQIPPYRVADAQEKAQNEARLRALAQEERFARFLAALAQAKAMPGGHCAGAVPGATLVQHDPDPNVGLAMNRECWGGNQGGGVVR
jgi:hypothetical protein